MYSGENSDLKGLLVLRLLVGRPLLLDLDLDLEQYFLV